MSVDEAINPEDIPASVVEAAQRFDYEHRPPPGAFGGWSEVHDAQVRRLLAGALTEVLEQVAQAVERECVDEEWPGDDISRNGKLAASVVRCWPEAAADA
jgi:hypothetical protein